MSLGGSLFVRDAVRLDYCVEAAIESLVPVCDEVVVLDCQSTDGTLALLYAVAARHPNVRVIANQPWEVGTNYDRLMIHANAAREQLQTRWHFMLQADEVLHEWSYPMLREAVRADGWGASTFRVRRFNLYGDFSRCVSLDSTMKPCADEPTRLALSNYPAVRDAETIGEPDGKDERLIEHVTILHYGFVRRGAALIDKAIEMQGWFNGPEGTVDERVLKMRDEGTGFRYQDIMPDDQLMPLPIGHPAAAMSWIKEH
jgi:glycosyltransferase involved in cell wall biosynthesis